MFNTYHNKGMIAFRKQRYLSARALFVQAVVANPEVPESYFYLGKCQFICREKEQAIMSLNKFIEMKPGDRNSSYAHDLLGQCYEAGDDNENALSSYEKALEIKPQNFSALHNIGVFYKKSAQKLVTSNLEASERLFDLARVSLLSALEIRKTNSTLFYSLASYYEEYIELLLVQTPADNGKIEHHYQEAIQYYEEASKICNEEDTSLKTLFITALTECIVQYGHHLYQNKEYRRAEAAYLKGIQLDPYHFTAISQLGVSLLRQNRFSEARHYFKDILKKTRDTQEIADAWLAIAETYRLEANWAKAKNALLQAKHFAPEDEAIPKEEAKLMEMISAAFYSAISTNQRSDAEKIIPFVPQESVISSIKYLSYLVFRNAADSGDIEMVNYLFTIAPELVTSMIKSHNFNSFRVAALKGNLSLIALFIEKIDPERLLSMIATEDFEAFSLAAGKGHVDIMKLLVSHAPEQVQAMIKANKYAAFDKAKQNGHQAVVDYIITLVSTDSRREMLMNCWKTDDELQELMINAESKYAGIEEKINEKAFLWLAEREGFAPIYILGTIHVATVEVKERFRNLVDEILAKVETCFNEIKLPFGIHSNSGLDFLVNTHAVQMSKQQKSLEDERVRRLAHGAQYLEDAVAITNTIATNSALLEEYSNEYLAKASISYDPRNDPLIIEIGLKRRNVLWMERLLMESADQSASLAAVGALHNEGRFGLPNLLAHEGYTVTALVKTAPELKSALLKDAMQSGQTLFHASSSHMPQEPIDEFQCRSGRLT